jgi:hypothetical protein
VSEEPVSMCRAESECKNTTAAFFGALGAGISGKQNKAAEAYDTCVKRNLSAQKANMGVEPSREVSCTSKKDGNETKTVCETN